MLANLMRSLASAPYMNMGGKSCFSTPEWFHTAIPESPSTLDFPVALGVVSTGGGVLCARGGENSSKQRGQELGSSVGVNYIRCATAEPDCVEEGGNKGGRCAVLEGEDKDGFGETVHDSQSFGLASNGLALALEVHGVAGAGFVGSVAGEESVGETSFTLFVLTFSAIREPATNIGAHRRPKVVPGERGMHLGVGEVV